MHLWLLTALGLPVLGLVLVEQLFRNLAEDARWNAKPVCLGLASHLRLRHLLLLRGGAVTLKIQQDSFDIIIFFCFVQVLQNLVQSHDVFTVRVS